ncbi:MAG: amidohydrolase family protein [Longimicrobiales bacterium]
MTERKQTWSQAFPLALLAFLATPAPGSAQHEEPPPPAAYALENVTVRHADGRVDAGMNLVVRRGFIVAMGPGVAIPPDAWVLEGDSLWVYPGMVDAHGKAALDLPEVENPQGVLPWAPPRDAQGFTPHRLAAHYLLGVGADGRDARAAGVIASGIHPEGGMAPGQSVTVLFRKDARTPWETVAQPNPGLFFSFQGARGVYPGTLFGVMAHFRQMFEDAGRQGLIEGEYARSPEGLTLPKWDPDFEVLRRAAAGQVPVFFAANSAGDIRRVLSLSDEIGFRPIIVGGEEAWRVSDELGPRGIPVLVSVGFPAPTEWEPPETGEAEGADAAQATLEPGAAREKERLENAYANAARLVEAGITVALTSGGDGGDFRAGVAKAIEYGLSEADALRAVTTTPASILGVPHVVTLGEGMAANFIVADGPIFGEETGILFTFVEGRMEEGRERSRGGTGEAPTVDVTGGWNVVVSAQGMEMPFTMILSQDGASFSGTMSSAEAGEAQVRRGTVSGNELSFMLVFSMGTESMEMEAKATVEGESMKGSGSSQMGAFTFRAARKPGSEGGIR